MPKITYITFEGHEFTVEASEGQSVMACAVKNGVPGIEAECGGACACATCHIHVDEAWRDAVGGPSGVEVAMLDFVGDVQPNSRLACQIKMSTSLDGLVVWLPESQY